MNESNREDRLLANALKEAMDLDLADIGKRRRRANFLRYGGMAAVLVCVLGLAALTSNMRMGSDKSGASMDMSQSSESADEVWQDAEPTEDETEDAALDDADDSDGNAARELAPNWQEELLAESAKADELVHWSYDTEEGEDLIYLQSEMHTKRTLCISDVYEVYYETGENQWERVYLGERVMNTYREGLVWVDGYLPQDYNMTRSGHYRLVRQVGIYRQVIELELWMN
jgi:hypothetical protein